MAKGYPASKRDEHHDFLPGGLVPEGVCLVCKRRRADEGAFCATCAAQLRPGSAPG